MLLHAWKPSFFSKITASGKFSLSKHLCFRYLFLWDIRSCTCFIYSYDISFHIRQNLMLYEFHPVLISKPVWNIYICVLGFAIFLWGVALRNLPFNPHVGSLLLPSLTGPAHIRTCLDTVLCIQIPVRNFYGRLPLTTGFTTYFRRNEIFHPVDLSP